MSSANFKDRISDLRNINKYPGADDYWAASKRNPLLAQIAPVPGVQNPMQPLMTPPTTTTTTTILGATNPFSQSGP